MDRKHPAIFKVLKGERLTLSRQEEVVEEEVGVGRAGHGGPGKP